MNILTRLDLWSAAPRLHREPFSGQHPRIILRKIKVQNLTGSLGAKKVYTVQETKGDEISYCNKYGQRFDIADVNSNQHGGRKHHCRDGKSEGQIFLEKQAGIKVIIKGISYPNAFVNATELLNPATTMMVRTITGKKCNIQLTTMVVTHDCYIRA
jgi:hypothetical protein